MNLKVCDVTYFIRGIVTNNRLGVRVQIKTFFALYVQTWYKSLMFLHCVKNIEHNIKENICTNMEVISLMPP